MIKRGVLLGVCCMFLGVMQAVNVFAEVSQKKVSAVSAEVPQKHVWNVGLSVSDIAYEEPGVMTEDGTFFGINGSYAYHNKLMLKVEGRYAFGTVQYQGTGTVNNDDYMWELRGLAGYDFVGSVTLTPYTGIAYRYLNDGLQEYSGGYERESNYYYSPLGLEINKKFANGWSWSTTLEYDIFWSGLQVSHLGDAVPGVDDLENDQDTGYGYRVSMKFQNKNGFGIEPYLKYWDIGKSDVKDITADGIPTGYIGWEPKNHSQEIGIIFAMKF